MVAPLARDSSFRTFSALVSGGRPLGLRLSGFEFARWPLDLDIVVHPYESPANSGACTTSSPEWIGPATCMLPLLGMSSGTWMLDPQKY
jgi:hypothetical protein